MEVKGKKRVYFSFLKEQDLEREKVDKVLERIIVKTLNEWGGKLKK